MRKWIICLLALPLASAVANDALPEQFRQPFSESYEIRKERYQEMIAYFERLKNSAEQTLQEAFQPDYSSLEAYEASMERFRNAVRDYYKMPPALAQPEATVRLEKIGEDQYANIYRAWISVLSGVELYSLYMVPKGLEGPAPMIITQHGGGGCPEAICDLDTRSNYDSFGPKAVRRGYIVWAPYSIMPVPYAGDSEEEIDRNRLSEMAATVDETLRGIEIYQIAHGAEAIARARDEVDENRIGMTGLSYGGGMTVRTMALTPFIKVGAPSAGFRGASRRSGPSSVQLVGAICPRPLMIQSGEVDTVAPMEDVRPGIPIVQGYYEKLGAADNLVFDPHPGGHVSVSENILDFFDQHLK